MPPATQAGGVFNIFFPDSHREGLIVLKIVCYVHAYVPHHNGGAETTLHDLNRALVEAGHSVTVVIREHPFRKPTPSYSFEGVDVVYADDKKTILHYTDADLILTHLECSIRATLLGKNFRIPVGQIIHNDLDLTKYYIGHGADFLVYNTDWIREKFSEEFGHIPSVVVHPPILADRYKTDRGKKVTLVNLFERKGSSMFYGLAARMPDVNFLGVVGGYGKQDIRDGFPNVEFMDHTSDMKDVYSETKVILMPSLYESYGRVACEAAASGIPSIVSSTLGLREALGGSAVFLPSNDVEGWEKALKSLLTPRKYGAMSKAAFERSKALHTMAVQELEIFVSFCERFTKTYKMVR